MHNMRPIELSQWWLNCKLTHLIKVNTVENKHITEGYNNVWLKMFQLTQALCQQHMYEYVGPMLSLQNRSSIQVAMLMLECENWTVTNCTEFLMDQTLNFTEFGKKHWHNCCLYFWPQNAEQLNFKLFFQRWEIASRCHCVAKLSKGD